MSFDLVSYAMGMANGTGGGGGGGGTPAVYSGTETPAASLGSDGDVYIKYTVQGNSGLVDSQLGWACPPLYYATKAGTEYGSLGGRWYKKSYDAPGITCYALHNTATIPGAASPYTFPMTISTTKPGASKIDAYTQEPTADSEWKSCTYGGMTWWFDIGFGMGGTYTASGGQLSIQSRINLPNTVTTWEEACQYALEQIGVVTNVAVPGTVYIKDSGTWTVAP